ncbi:MAG: chloride channel protein [Chthoniobacterales bacterium]
MKWLQHQKPQVRLISITVLAGILGSLLAVAFTKSIDFIALTIWEPVFTFSALEVILYSGGILLLVGLITGVLLAFIAPEAAGSGIPQVKLSYWRDMGRIPARTVVTKFIAGAISVGGGMSLGREGPTVQLAAGAASALGRRLGFIGKEMRAITASGAAAGLAAAFNTPMAAVAFVLEEVLEDLNSRFIGRMLLASVVSIMALYLLAGPETTFHIPATESFFWRVYILVLPVGALAALIGVAFQKATLGWRKRVNSTSRIPIWLRPTVGAMITWVVLCTVFFSTERTGIQGLGYHDLNTVLAGGLTISVIAVLLVGKWIATTASYAWGGCGGIFAPMLFLGAMLGSLFAQSIDFYIDLHENELQVLAVAGMCACLGAAVRAPVTSILIVFEMTHDFALVPPLMLATLVSQGVSRALCSHNFYNQLLLDDGAPIDSFLPVRTFADWQMRRVASYARFNPKVVIEQDIKNVAQVLKSTPYEAYPVVSKKDSLVGILSRRELKSFLETETWPQPHVAAALPMDATLLDAETAFIEAPLHVVTLVQGKDRQAAAIFTLHDLLRCQLKMADEK